jgi:hypothetical protein
MFSRTKPDMPTTSVEQFSSTRVERPFSTLVDADIRAGERAIANSHIDGGNYCLFVDGEWNCVGERCSNGGHRSS